MTLGVDDLLTRLRWRRRSIGRGLFAFWALSLCCWLAVATVAASIAIERASVATDLVRRLPLAGPALGFGLLGLAGAGDGRDEIGELTDRVRRLAGGEGDVAIETDREDEIGELYDAVDELADRVREERRTDAEAEDYRRELYEISSSTTLSDEEKVGRILELGCARLGTEAGVVTRIDVEAGRYLIQYARGSDFVAAGTDADLFTTFCRRTIESDEILGIFDAMEEGYETDPGVEEWGIECYVGGKIEVSEGPYGTVCFVGGDPRGEPFSHEEKTFVDLASRWLSYLFESRERERRLEQLTENTDDVLWMYDGEWEDVLFVNSAFEDVWERPTAWLREHPHGFIDVVHPDDREQVERGMGEVAEGASRDLEYRIEVDGEYRWVWVKADPILDARESVVRVVGLTRDVTERKHREEELAETRDHLSAIVEASPDAIISIDADGIVDLWNPAAERIFGWDAEEVLGEPLPFVPEEYEEEFERLLQRVFDGDLIQGEEIERQRRDGSVVDVSLSAAPLRGEDGEVTGVMAALEDVSERVARERELARAKDLMEQAQRMAGVGGWELDLTTDPPAFTWTEEMYRLHGVEPGTEVTLEDAVQYYHPDDREQIRETMDDAVESGESYDMEVRIQPSSDELRWVRALGEPVYEDGEMVALRGSVQDVTPEREREATLRSLHETARGLLGAESREAVARLAVDTAAEVLDATGVVLYALDEETNRLVPVAAAGAFADADLPTIGPAEDDAVWEAYASGEPTVLDGERHTRALGPEAGGLLVPVGDYGALVAALPVAEIDGDERRLAETLVATTEAALDRIESEADLRERDAELAAQNRRLERQVQITDIIRRVDRTLVGAESGEEIESVVPERLIEAEDVAFAWIGGFDESRERVVARSWAGRTGTYLDDVGLERPTDSVEPAVRAVRTDEPVVVPNVVDCLQSEPWCEHALEAGYHSVVAVPLTFEGYTDGVLAVYADQPDAFRGFEREVFAELGEGIAHAVRAVETREGLRADTLTEVTLRFDEPEEFLSRIARETGGEVSFEAVGARSGEATQVFFAVSGADPAAVEDALADRYAIDDYRRLEGEGERSRFEARVSGAALPAALSAGGARPRSVRATATTTEAVVDLPSSTDVRAYVEGVAETYSSVELVGRRTVRRSMQSERELVTSLLGELTERQREVLRTAYYAGFFEWPRGSTGEEVAAMLDVSQPTVNRHLRLAQGQLLARLFDEERPLPATPDVDEA